VSVKEKVSHLTRGTTVQLNLADNNECVLKASVKPVLELVDKFETNFVNRLNIENGKNNVLECMDDVFDVDRMLLLSSDLARNVYSSLEEYVNLAKNVGAL